MTIGRTLLLVALLLAIAPPPPIVASAGSRTASRVTADPGPPPVRDALQAPDTVPGADTAPDPEEVVDEAKGRQRSFERYRRYRLPFAGGGSSGRCDEVVGRYCLWHEDDRDRDPEPPEEPESVTEDRDRLLEHLAAALEAVPGSDWLVGQRVRYLLEAERKGEALEEAAGCRASRWWCLALEGRVLHEMADFERAGRAFATALGAMDTERRRRWTDVSVLLEGDAEDRWEEMDEAGRARLTRRLWRLADPLWLVPGNDRWTEHMARRVAVRMREDTATPFEDHWNDALGELTIRYDVPWSFGRESLRPGPAPSRPSVVGRHHPDALRWLPSSEALLDPARAGPDDWELDDPEPRSEHAPPYADTTGRLDHWLSVFPRGDSTAVVAAYRSALRDDGEDGAPPAPDPAARDGAGDAAPADREALLRLVPVRSLDAEGSLPTRDDRWTGGARRGLSVQVATRPHVLSLELLRRGAREAERARYGLALERRPASLPGLSDLLVLEPGDSVPPGLEAALPRARGPGPARPGDRLGLYWELYGPSRLLEDVEVSLILAERGGNVLDRLAGALGLRDGRVVALGWRDRAGEGGRVHPRGVQLRLPEELSEGEYRLELSVRVPGYETLTSGRDLEVREPG